MPVLDLGNEPIGGPCYGSWIDDAVETCSCQPCDFSSDDDLYCLGGAEILERWVLIASRLLYAFSGRQFPGVCVDTVRPCSRGCAGQSLAYVASPGARPIVYHNVDDCQPGPGCGAHSSVLLPHEPVRSIIEVLVDGVPVDPSEYTLVDHRWLVKAHGSWPCCQNLGLPDDAPGTWSVAYEYGVPPPAGGAEIAALFACELAKGCVADQSCQLPTRVQTITREGLSMTVIDPFDFLDKGRTGLYAVDAWLRSVNPQGIDRPAKVLNVDLMRTHHVD